MGRARVPIACGAMDNYTSDAERVAWAEWCRARDEFFKHHYASPLPEETMDTFERIEYFPFNPDMIFETTMQPLATDEVEILSSTGSRSAYRAAGEVTLSFPGGEKSLVVLQGEEDDVFIPFSDATCGVESYGGGRYVSPIAGQGGTLVVEFNRTINPYCVYDPDFSCPLPPAQNRLPMRIEAGEKDFC